MKHEHISPLGHESEAEDMGEAVYHGDCGESVAFETSKLQLAFLDMPLAG